MSDNEKTEFEFQDSEIEQPKRGLAIKEPEPEIEIVDDTPEEDRGRTPMATPPQEPTDEELESYSKRDRNKIREFTKGYHEERRAKEAALREKEEAISLTKALFDENQRLKGTVNTSQSALLEQAKRVVAQELEEARRKYKNAYEAGDSDALVNAQEEMTSAKMKVERVNNFKPAPLQEQENVVQTTHLQAEPKPDYKAEDWRKQNSWWGQDKEMTSFALGVHDKLVNDEGVDPQSDDYYLRLNGRLRQVFPDKFESEESDDSKSHRPKSSVVASASRSVAPRKITLSQSEVNIAKRLGVPLEQYAREVAVLRRNQNG